MFKKLVYTAMAMSLFMVGCSTHQAHLDMEEFKEIPVKAGTPPGVELGPVSGSQGGAIWADCNETSRASIMELIQNAKAMGASAVGNVRWAASNNATPTCKKGWGWGLLWPVMLTPVFMSTQVNGVAYKADEARIKKNGWLKLPATETEEVAFVETVLAL